MITEQDKASACIACGDANPRHFLDATDQKTGDPTHRLRLVQCRRCGLVYLFPRPLPSIAEQYFNDVYTGKLQGGRFDTYYHDDEQILAKHATRIAWLEQRCSPGQLLDVGAGRGHFLLAASRSGWNCIGVELDADAAEYACREHGLKVLSGTLENAPLPEGQFDVITMWDLIEHVDDPLTLLRQTWKLLREGGHVVIRTGNVDAWKVARSPANWDMLFSGHLYYFSPRSIRRLLHEAGFQQVTVDDAKQIEGYVSSGKIQGLETNSVNSGIQAVISNPTRLAKVPKAILRKLKYQVHKRRFPDCYDINIMMVLARK